MLSPRTIAISLAALSSLVSAAIFPSGTQVKLIDAKGFKKAMKANETSMVAFVAPWCGHCQRMAPEYSKAASSLHPLVPLYAVDCDEEKNKRLCSEQGVQGFPTVKLFPRGSKLAPMTYEGERVSSGFFKYASLRIPKTVTKLDKFDDIAPWTSKKIAKPRALLLTQDSKVPLLWKVLGNKYQGQVELGIHRDVKGKALEAYGLDIIIDEKDKKGAQVLVFSTGSSRPVLFEGPRKLEALSVFLDSAIDGSLAGNDASDSDSGSSEYHKDEL